MFLTMFFILLTGAFNLIFFLIFKVNKIETPLKIYFLCKILNSSKIKSQYFHIKVTFIRQYMYFCFTYTQKNLIAFYIFIQSEKSFKKMLMNSILKIIFWGRQFNNRCHRKRTILIKDVSQFQENETIYSILSN